MVIFCHAFSPHSIENVFHNKTVDVVSKKNCQTLAYKPPTPVSVFLSIECPHSYLPFDIFCIPPLPSRYFLHPTPNNRWLSMRNAHKHGAGPLPLKTDCLKSSFLLCEFFYAHISQLLHCPQNTLLWTGFLGLRWRIPLQKNKGSNAVISAAAETEKTSLSMHGSWSTPFLRAVDTPNSPWTDQAHQWPRQCSLFTPPPRSDNGDGTDRRRGRISGDGNRKA